MKQKAARKKIKIKNTPLHYISRDGYHIYVGKNNLQNDELTFSFAVGNDWWFHAKQAPGFPRDRKDQRGRASGFHL